MTLRPVGPHILVRPDAIPKETASGIALPETWARPPQTAVVVAVGDPRVVLLSNMDSGQAGYRKVSTEDFKVAQRVAHRHGDGETRTFDQPDGSKLKFLKLEEVIGTVE